MFSDYTSDDLYRRGAKRGSIDPCFPSKLGIPHVHDLLFVQHAKTPLTHIFFPMVDSFPTFLDHVQGSRACPTVVATPEAVHAAFTTEHDLFAEPPVVDDERAAPFQAHEELVLSAVRVLAPYVPRGHVMHNEHASRLERHLRADFSSNQTAAQILELGKPADTHAPDARVARP